VPSSVTLNPDQQDIREVARSFLRARHPVEEIRGRLGDHKPDPAAWQEICELGWPGIALAEERGGAGYGTVERCLILEEAGRVLLSEPFLSSAVLAADAVAVAAGAAGDELLEQIVSGAARATLVAAGDLLAGERPAASVTEAAGALSGPGGLVLDADRADVLVAAATRIDGTTGLFRVDADARGVSIERYPLADRTRGCGEVVFDGAAAQLLSDGDCADELATALQRAAIAISAEMVGGAQEAVDITLAYLKERQQFGVPIGSFQALKHRMASVHVDVVAAREMVYLAADADDEGQTAVLAGVASAAKVAASDAFVRAAAEAIQMHGGIGMTEESDAQLYYKRALVSAEALGTSACHRARLARVLDA
jgi:alkylation response protein AidB-like acyl-CoA dehydrogenase